MHRRSAGILKRMNLVTRTLLLITALGISTDAFADTAYAEKAGSSVGVYRNEALNYAIDLDGKPYVVVDFSEQMPDASFAAMRFDPLIFTMTIVEDMGTEMEPEQYAEMVIAATEESFAGQGKTMDGPMRVIKKI